MPKFPLKLQIVDSEGVVLELPGGGPLEADLIQACTDAVLARGVGSLPLTLTLAVSRGVNDVIARCTAAIVARGVGLGRTSRHVAQDVQDGLREILTGDIMSAQHLSWESREAEEAISLGLRDAVQALKERTRQVV